MCIYWLSGFATQCSHITSSAINASKRLCCFSLTAAKPADLLLSFVVLPSCSKASQIFAIGTKLSVWAFFNQILLFFVQKYHFSISQVWFWPEMRNGVLFVGIASQFFQF